MLSTEGLISFARTNHQFTCVYVFCLTTLKNSFIDLHNAEYFGTIKREIHTQMQNARLFFFFPQ